MDWEDLRFFLAVAKTGTLAGAGRQLDVQHSTVLRRIASLEAGLGSRLFERHPSGYRLTPAGTELLDATQPLEEELVAVQRRLSGFDQRLTGTVRIATLEPLSPWVCEALARLHRANPQVRAEMLISPVAVSLARHEADIAVRVTVSPPEYLVGRRVATLAHGIYAVAEHPAAKDGDYARHDWLSYSSGRSELAQARWVSEHIPAERVVFRTNQTQTLVWAAAAGMGLAILPCYLGDRHPALRRLKTLPAFGQDLWLLTHQDLRRSLRVKTLMDCLAEELLKHKGLIEGAEQTD